MLREEVRQRFEREKQAYWAMRADLLKQYPGKWVAVVNGQVVAIGDNRGKVMEQAYRQTKSKVMFVSEVGHEDRVLGIRQHSTGQFDHSYQPPVPMMTAPVSDIVNAISLNMDLIVDTGAA